MRKEKVMLVYLSDLAHDYFKVNQYTPTGVGYLATYAQSKLGKQVSVSNLARDDTDKADMEKHFKIIY